MKHSNLYLGLVLPSGGWQNLIGIFFPAMLYKIKSAASFCCQVAAWVQDILCKFCLGKNHKIINNSETPKAVEK